MRHTTRDALMNVSQSSDVGSSLHPVLSCRTASSASATSREMGALTPGPRYLHDPKTMYVTRTQMLEYSP